ncbi:hypothetical protein [Jannaschia sp. W003]|uniref:cysteine dioxygenase family protein n=1 Tax=Jannaschia sp. W003 TaxID=2867012 RepID=UPI0021A42061|nr:hypothetical protein [Jannaschia sp. W003]UWQ21660.1 hypothetical protein K3554_01115 [Jannaschia sp. W003]
MFDPERFVEDCRDAVRQDASHRAVAEVMRRALSDPGAVMDAFGAPEGPGLEPLYRNSDLTILRLAWKPTMMIPPHDHAMWAVIGIYGGREDNIFWRRLEGEAEGRIEAAGARALSTGDVCPMGPDIIHSVANPIPRLTAALHVYGGDFFEAERHEWEPEALTERPLDMAAVRARFSD